MDKLCIEILTFSEVNVKKYDVLKREREEFTARGGVKELSVYTGNILRCNILCKLFSRHCFMLLPAKLTTCFSDTYFQVRPT